MSPGAARRRSRLFGELRRVAAQRLQRVGALVLAYYAEHSDGLASLLELTLFPGIAAAQSNTAIGVGPGAVTGAVVGGPVGAVVGAVVGGLVGAATEPSAIRSA